MTETLFTNSPRDGLYVKLLQLFDLKKAVILSLIHDQVLAGKHVYVDGHIWYNGSLKFIHSRIGGSYRNVLANVSSLEAEGIITKTTVSRNNDTLIRINYDNPKLEDCGENFGRRKLVIGAYGWEGDNNPLEEELKKSMDINVNDEVKTMLVKLLLQEQFTVYFLESSLKNMSPERCYNSVKQYILNRISSKLEHRLTVPEELKDYDIFYATLCVGLNTMQVRPNRLISKDKNSNMFYGYMALKQAEKSLPKGSKLIDRFIEELLKLGIKDPRKALSVDIIKKCIANF